MTRSTRMLWGMCWMLAAVPLVSACGDSPSAPGVERAARDLDFVMPAVKGGAPAVVAQEAGEWDDGPSATEVVAGFAAAKSEGKGERAYIHDRFVTAYWSGAKLIYEYGMVAFGTGYSMKPRVDVRNVDGTSVLGQSGNGISLNLGIIPLPLRPRMKDEVLVGPTCGLLANVNVTYTAFLGIKLDPLDLSVSASVDDGTSASQPGCQSPSSGGGGGGGWVPGSTGGYTICYYEVWVDIDGYIVEMILLGCHRVGGGLAT